MVNSIRKIKPTRKAEISLSTIKRRHSTSANKPGQEVPMIARIKPKRKMPKSLAKSPTTDPKVARLMWLSSYLKSVNCGLALWDRVFTKQEKEQLGGDFNAAMERHRRPIAMKIALTGQSPREAALDIAHSLGCLSESDHRWLFGDANRPTAGLKRMRPVEDEITLEAAKYKSLVLVVENPREVYWMNRRIDVSWDRKPMLWAFLYTLCQRAKLARGASWDEFPSSKDHSYLSKQKSRLKMMKGFPAELAEKIKPVGRGSMRLMIAPNDIRGFELEMHDNLVEWKPDGNAH